MHANLQLTCILLSDNAVLHCEHTVNYHHLHLPFSAVTLTCNAMVSQRYACVVRNDAGKWKI